MAILARRVLQRLIRDNAAFMSLQQRARHAAALNRADDASIGVEWEIIVLNGLATSAHIDHEPLLGTRRPDVLATVGAAGETTQFVADIATIYETGYDELNPIQALSDALVARSRKLGITKVGYAIDVAGDLVGDKAKQHMRLKLPRRADVPHFVRTHLEPFLKQCKADPQTPHTLHVKENGIDFSLKSEPGSETLTLHYPSYTARYSKTRNSIFNVLKRKARQLRDTAFEGPRGIILCAADMTLCGSGGGAHSVKAVVGEVFRQYPAVSFVLLVEARDPVFGRGEYKSELLTNPSARRPLPPRPYAVLERLTDAFPMPRNSGINALNEIRFWRWKRGRYFWGSLSMSRITVKISARVLLEYLAGTMSTEDFLAATGGHLGYVPLFAQKLRDGQLINGVRFEHEADKDDDWITFEFSEPDPALAPISAE